MKLFAMPNPAPVECSPEPHALQQRQTLLDAAENLQVVKTALDNEYASQCGQAIQKLVKDVEATRKDLTAPYLAAQRAIKKVADDFTEPLVAALARLGRLTISYRQELERQAEAERKARAEAIAKAELQQRQAEEAAKLAAQKGDLEAQLQADIAAQALATKALETIMVPIPESPKTEGQSFQERDLCWECTDSVALWNARPDLCNPPTPKASAIKAVCDPDRPIPGLRLWWESKVTFRSR